jgi:hypothetical protein
LREPRKNYPKEEELSQDKHRVEVFLPTVLLTSGNTPKNRAEGNDVHLTVDCTYYFGCRLDVEGIEVSHPLLKTWLDAVDVKDVADLAGDRRIPKHPKFHS